MECNNFRAVRQQPAPGSEHNRPAPGTPHLVPPNTPLTQYADWPRHSVWQSNTAGPEARNAIREPRQQPSLRRFQLPPLRPINAGLSAIASALTDRGAHNRPRRAVRIDPRDVAPFLLRPFTPAAPYTPSPGLSPNSTAGALQPLHLIRTSVRAPSVQAPSIRAPSAQISGIDRVDPRIAARNKRIMQARHLLTAWARADTGRETAPLRESLPPGIRQQAAPPVIDQRVDSSRVFLLDIACNGTQPVPGKVPSHRLPDLRFPGTAEHLKRPQALDHPAFHTDPAARTTLDARPRRQVAVMHIPSS